LAQRTDMLGPLLFARMATMIITHTLARLTVTTARIGSWAESSSGLARGSTAMAAVSTVGASTVVVVMVIVAADLTTRDSEVTAASTAVKVSTGVAVSMVIVDFMEAAGFTAAVAGSMEEAVSMAVVEATGAGIANCQES
jgi:hypothetical protein